MIQTDSITPSNCKVFVTVEPVVSHLNQAGLVCFVTLIIDYIQNAFMLLCLFKIWYSTLKFME